MEDIQEWRENFTKFIESKPNITQVFFDLNIVGDPETLTWAVALIRTYRDGIDIKFFCSCGCSTETLDDRKTISPPD